MRASRGILGVLSLSCRSVIHTRAFATQPNTCATKVNMSSNFRTREIDQTVESRAQREGHGATVYRSIGGPRLRNLDPFLMLDEFMTGEPDPNNPIGFPDHPHRGFETVSYLLQGTFSHEDFMGNKGTLRPGDLQWMTAGKGIVHSEMPGTDGPVRGLQLWVNLKSQYKMIPPAYQELKKEDIPVKTEGGVTAIIIAGSALGVNSPVYTRTPTHYIHYKLEPNSSVNHAIPEGWASFLYTLSGKVYVGNAQSSIGAHYTITLNQNGEGVTLRTEAEPAEFVLLAGEPTNEPVYQHGPFVMNTQQEIMQAIRDFQTASNGFENAHDWYSIIGLPITHADQRRR